MRKDYVIDFQKVKDLEDVVAILMGMNLVISTDADGNLMTPELNNLKERGLLTEA